MKSSLVSSAANASLRVIIGMIHRGRAQRPHIIVSFDAGLALLRVRLLRRKEWLRACLAESCRGMIFPTKTL